MRRTFGSVLALVVLAVLSTACTVGEASQTTLTIYSSRTQSLVQPLLEQFAADTGININVRYDTTAGVVSTLLEEGARSPADVVYLAESSGLGALSERGALATLPETVLSSVDQRFRSSKGEWVGVSGRAKTVVYNTTRIDPARDLPSSILQFTDPVWKGRIGWAPTHGEWQLLVTAIRLTHGEDTARRWLEGLKANAPKTYRNLISIVQAVADGEVDVGFVNHYYVLRFVKERGPGFAARNHFLGRGDPGALIDVTGIGILKTSQNRDAAERFVRYLLSEPAQRYFAEQTFEYPVSAGVAPAAGLPPLATLDPPRIDPDKLADLQGTLRLLRATGVLP